MSLVEVQEAINPVIDGLGYPVAWPNADSRPTEPYFRVTYLESLSEANTYGCDRMPGIVQVDAFVKDGSGAIQAAEMGELVRDAFKLGSIFQFGSTRVYIDRQPWFGPGLNRDGWYSIPINIPYEVYR